MWTSIRCELDYQATPYVAEFFNTLSSLPIAFLGAYGLLKARKYGVMPLVRLLLNSDLQVQHPEMQY